MQHSHWQEPQASQDMLPVTALKSCRATQKHNSRSSYRANNVPSQSLKLLGQVMLKAWLGNAQNFLTQTARYPGSDPKYHHRWTDEKHSSAASPEISEGASQNHYKIISRKHIHIAKLKCEQSRRKQEWQTKKSQHIESLAEFLLGCK